MKNNELDLYSWILLSIVPVGFIIFVITAVVCIAINGDERYKTAVAQANQQFINKNCRRDRYIASKYEPIMIYRCDNGEYTFDEMIQDELRKIN